MQVKTRKSIKVLHKAIKIKPLNIQQERFCNNFVNIDALFSNATLSYAEAYGYDIDGASQEPEKDEKGRDIPLSSDYHRMYNTCGVNGSRLLKNDKINTRINELFLLSMNDGMVDQELVKVIKQNYKLDSKVSAIKEYNKLKQRIVERLDHTSDGKPITIQISEAVARKNGL